MKHLQLLALITMLFASSTARSSCDDSQNQPGIFPFKDDHRVTTALMQLQSAVLESDKAAVARMVYFPVTVRIHGKRRSVDRRRFLADYPAILNPAVRAAISAARFQSRSDYSCVFWNSHGLMLGAGEIWFGATASGNVKVIAINN